jgi:hypothetical protein
LHSSPPLTPIINQEKREREPVDLRKARIHITDGSREDAGVFELDSQTQGSGLAVEIRVELVRAVG